MRTVSAFEIAQPVLAGAHLQSAVLPLRLTGPAHGQYRVFPVSLRLGELDGWGESDQLPVGGLGGDGVRRQDLVLLAGGRWGVLVELARRHQPHRAARPVDPDVITAAARRRVDDPRAASGQFLWRQSQVGNFAGSVALDEYVGAGGKVEGLLAGLGLVEVKPARPPEPGAGVQDEALV